MGSGESPRGKLKNNLEDLVHKAKKEIKLWERQFESEHGGQKPTPSDITEANMEGKYKEYKRLQKRLKKENILREKRLERERMKENNPSFALAKGVDNNLPPATHSTPQPSPSQKKAPTAGRLSRFGSAGLSSTLSPVPSSPIPTNIASQPLPSSTQSTTTASNTPVSTSLSNDNPSTTTSNESSTSASNTTVSTSLPHDKPSSTTSNEPSTSTKPSTTASVSSTPSTPTLSSSGRLSKFAALFGNKAFSSPSSNPPQSPSTNSTPVQPAPQPTTTTTATTSSTTRTKKNGYSLEKQLEVQLREEETIEMFLKKREEMFKLFSFLPLQPNQKIDIQHNENKQQHVSFDLTASDSKEVKEIEKISSIRANSMMKSCLKWKTPSCLRQFKSQYKEEEDDIKDEDLDALEKKLNAKKDAESKKRNREDDDEFEDEEKRDLKRQKGKNENGTNSSGQAAAQHSNPLWKSFKGKRENFRKLNLKSKQKARDWKWRRTYGSSFKKRNNNTTPQATSSNSG